MSASDDEWRRRRRKSSRGELMSSDSTNTLRLRSFRRHALILGGCYTPAEERRTIYSIHYTPITVSLMLYLASCLQPPLDFLLYRTMLYIPHSYKWTETSSLVAQFVIYNTLLSSWPVGLAFMLFYTKCVIIYK